MQWTIRQIKWAFSGRLVGSVVMKETVCQNVQSLPFEMIKYITTSIWFISSPEDAWAFAFRGSDIKDQYLIFLSDELFKQTQNQIRYTILHEIGHVILKHRNSMGYRQPETEIKQQETEADQFANKYLTK